MSKETSGSTGRWHLGEHWHGEAVPPRLPTRRRLIRFGAVAVSERTFSLGGDEPAHVHVWAAEGTGFARRENRGDVVAVSWSTGWRHQKLARLLQHAGARGLKRLIDRDTVDLANPLQKQTAMIVFKGGETRSVVGASETGDELAECGDLVDLVRLDLGNAAVVWTRVSKLHGWDGPTLGFIGDSDWTHYTRKLLKASATPPIAQLAETIVSSEGPVDKS